MAKVLEVENLRTRFFTSAGTVRAVDGISYTVEEGESVAIVGEPGRAKSVSALSVLRLIPDPPGRIVGGSEVRDVPKESLMITGDLNVIDVDFIVQWRIKNARDFLLNIRNPDATVKIVVESAMREVIGQARLEDALTVRRQEIEQLTRELLQQVLDDYGSGVLIADLKLQKVDPPGAVIDAFNNVQRARQDKERKQNEAEGEAKRFLAEYETYKVAKGVTTQRLYLEALEEILRGTQKVIIDSQSRGRPGRGARPALARAAKARRGNQAMNHVAPREALRDGRLETARLKRVKLV